MEHYLRTGSVRSSVKLPNSTKPLSYLASKSVLEHMEANTRCLLASHCPSLRGLHTTVPIKIQNFKIAEKRVLINNYKHIFSRGTREGQVFTRYSVRSGNKKRAFFHSPSGVEPRSALEHFLRELCLRTPPILVRYHEIDEVFANEDEEVWEFHGLPDEDPQIPEGVQFRVRELSVPKGYFNIQQFVLFQKTFPLLHQSSFPLKKLWVEVEDPEDDVFQSEALRTAKALDIEVDNRFAGRLWVEPFTKLTNQKVFVTLRDVPVHLLAQIALGWLERGDREIGTTYSFHAWFSVTDMASLSNEITGLSGFQTHQKKICGLPCFNYQMSGDKELNIFRKEASNFAEERANFNGKPWIVVMAVMEAGSAKP